MVENRRLGIDVGGAQLNLQDIDQALDDQPIEKGEWVSINDSGVVATVTDIYDTYVVYHTERKDIPEKVPRELPILLFKQRYCKK